MIEFPQSNAPTAQQKWVRAVEKALREANDLASTIKNRTSNSASAQNGTSGLLQKQVSTLLGQVDQLQEQGTHLDRNTATLQQTVDYINSLVTVSSNGVTFNTGDIPGDQTYRYGRGTAVVTLRVPTGRMLVTVSAGQCTLAAGTTSAIGMITFDTRADGFQITPEAQKTARLYLQNGMSIGVPLLLNRVVENVPVDRDVTVAQYFGTWSASANASANAQFTSNSITVQVLGD